VRGRELITPSYSITTIRESSLTFLTYGDNNFSLNILLTQMRCMLKVKRPEHPLKQGLVGAKSVVRYT